MPHKPLETVLINFGLTDYEAKVYLAALSLGPATVLKISQAAEIKRTTVYSVIEALKFKGLVNVEVHGFKQRFAAEHPSKLETILENRKALLTKTMPEFTSLYNLKGGESTIKFYEGLPGVKSTYESLLSDIQPKEDYCIVSNQEQWFGLDYDFFMDFTRRRAKLNINIRLLLQDSAIARESKRHEKNYNEYIKILPPGTAIDTNLVIIPKRVVIHQLVPPISAIVIENPIVVQMHKELFEVIWNSIPE